MHSLQKKMEKAELLKKRLFELRQVFEARRALCREVLQKQQCFFYVEGGELSPQLKAEKEAFVRQLSVLADKIAQMQRRTHRLRERLQVPLSPLQKARPPKPEEN
ncbi:MAG: hypothetical protein FWG75_06085 [Cystobacterineae bacterium]|nr:hypothetical protein [Cystobacterineae bacterium]